MIWKPPGMMSDGLALGPKILGTPAYWNKLLPTNVF